MPTGEGIVRLGAGKTCFESSSPETRRLSPVCHAKKGWNVHQGLEAVAWRSCVGCNRPGTFNTRTQHCSVISCRYYDKTPTEWMQEAMAAASAPPVNLIEVAEARLERLEQFEILAREYLNVVSCRVCGGPKAKPYVCPHCANGD